MIQLNDISPGPNSSLPILCITGMLLILPENSHALEWKDLWQTPDQQAQNAFQKQQYEQAAEQFEQSEWKASAQYKAGQYEQVIDTLKDIHTSEGYYNQGNAYVKQGKLQEALEAYKKSLEIDPENTDAKYNKELIEKEQKEQQKGEGEGEGEGDSQDQEPQEKSDSQNQDEEQGNQGGDQPETDKDQKESESQGENQQDADKNDSDAKPEQSENQQQESDESTKDAESGKPSEEETGENDAETSAVDQSNAPKDESEQASEQWLKRIPDDPAGLLKRKFEYQYKQRPRDSRDQQENW